MLAVVLSCWCTCSAVETRAKVSSLSLFLILYCLATSALAVPELVLKAMYSLSVIKAFVCDYGLKATFLICPQNLV